MAEARRAHAAPEDPGRGLNRALDRLRALRALDHAILTAADVNEVAGVAVRRVRALLGVARVAVVGYDLRRHTGTILAVDEAKPIPEAPLGAAFRLADIIPADLLAAPVQRVYPDVDVTLRGLGAARAMALHGIHAVAWTPVTVDGRLLGMLVAGAHDDAPFDAEALEIADDVARQLAVGMRVVEERRAREGALRRLSALHAIDRAILDAVTIETLAATVLPQVIAGTHAAYGRLFRYDLLEGKVRLLADVRTDGGDTLAVGTVMPLELAVKPELLAKPRVRRLDRLEDGRPIRLGDTSLPVERGAHVWVPLLAGDRLVGAFALGYGDGDEPTDEDVAVATEVADQLAVAMVHAEARRTAERSLARLELVNAISAAILGAQTPEEVAQRAVAPLLGLASAERVTVVGYDLEAGTGTVLAFGQLGPGAEMAAGRVFPIDQIMPADVFGGTRALVFPDLSAIVDQLPASRDAVAQGFTSSVIVPLVAGGRVLGHLAVGSHDTAVASPDSVAVAEEVAGHLALAIHEAANRAALADREERLRVVLDASPNAVLVVDAAGLIRYANASAGAMFAADPTTLVAESIGVLVPEPARAQHPERVATWFSLAAAGVSSHPLDTEAVRLDGSTFPVHILHAPVETLGGTLAIVTIVDLSERVALESRLRQAERMEVLGQFAGMLAHDVRNSLTAVSWVADLLADDLDPDDPRREDVGVIRQAVDDAIAMTRTTLEYARPAASAVGRTDLATHLAGARKVLSRMLGDRVQLEIEAEPGLPSAGIDPTALTQVLVNLCSNARDAMPSGGTVRITASIHEAQGASAELEILRTEHLDLRVIDTGEGMDEATRSHAFEAFYTTRSRPVNDGRGTGLGLSSVWLLVTSAGGTVKIRSEPGEGTMFIVALPIAR